jgi:ribosomal protein S18 acetylase RimI-like enzyme
MATAAGSRGQGLGGEVLAAVVAELVRRGADLLWCESREVAIGFYEQHGFVADGPRYVHAEIGTVHQLMWRELSGPASQPGG